MKIVLSHFLSHFLASKSVFTDFCTNRCSFSGISGDDGAGEKVSWWALNGSLAGRIRVLESPLFSVNFVSVQRKRRRKRGLEQFFEGKVRQKCDMGQTVFSLINRGVQRIGENPCHTFENESVTYFSPCLSGSTTICHTCHTFLEVIYKKNFVSRKSLHVMIS